MAMKARRRPSWKLWRQLTRPGEQTPDSPIRFEKGHLRRPRSLAAAQLRAGRVPAN